MLWLSSMPCKCYFLYGLCCCMCSEQTAGRQREGGSSSGELLAAGGGQPVPDHQEHLSSQSALSSPAFKPPIIAAEFSVTPITLDSFFENWDVSKLANHPRLIQVWVAATELLLALTQQNKVRIMQMFTQPVPVFPGEKHRGNSWMCPPEESNRNCYS